MPKAGRNGACPCGSGKKYKRCCLVQAAERGRVAQAAVVRQVEDALYNEFAAASNRIVTLVDTGQLDEAEEAAHGLLERFPGYHDGYARLGLIHEMRGNTEKAIEYYRKVIDFARRNPDAEEPVVEADYQRIIDRLAASEPPP